MINSQRSDLSKLAGQIQDLFLRYKSYVKRPAQGQLKHDYLVPAGPYQEQWDWDAFFIGMSLLSDIPSEAIYLKNCARNLLEHTNAKTGFTPGLLTPTGRDKRLHHAKPFLAQMVYFASANLQDFFWVKPYLIRLQRAITYRERHLWSAKYGLGMWHDSMESGADNNPAILNYPLGTVIGADLNTFIYREYLAMAKIAGALYQKGVAKKFQQKAQGIRAAINKFLWDEQRGSYYNLDTATNKLILRDTYSNFVPLWASLASPERGCCIIRRYLLNPKKMWGKYGIRTLAKDDPSYNNVNMIKPHSNWQGPVWPIANYLYMQALLNYGFKSEALILAEKIVCLCLKDIQKSCGMHENYHAETGQPLAAPNFVSWNLLVAQMIPQAQARVNTFAIK